MSEIYVFLSLNLFRCFQCFQIIRLQDAQFYQENAKNNVYWDEKVPSGNAELSMEEGYRKHCQRSYHLDEIHFLSKKIFHIVPYELTKINAMLLLPLLERPFLGYHDLS